MNCNGRLADIWLIYRCTTCDASRNVTVVERTPVGRIPVDLFTAATENDAVVAGRLARDVGLLKSAGFVVARGDRFEVSGGPVDLDWSGGKIDLVFPEPLLVQLDEVIAAATAQPRSWVRRRLVEGSVCVPEGSPRTDRLRLWSTVVVAAQRPASTRCFTEASKPRTPTT